MIGYSGPEHSLPLSAGGVRSREVIAQGAGGLALLMRYSLGL